jgi:hypothetical protein
LARIPSFTSFYEVMRTLGEQAAEGDAAIAADRATRIDPVPLSWDYVDPAPRVEFLGFKHEVVKNPLLGVDQIVWSDTPVTTTVEQSVRSAVAESAERPVAYYLPAVWTQAIDVLRHHGIEMEVLDAPA